MITHVFYRSRPAPPGYDLATNELFFERYVRRHGDRSAPLELPSSAWDAIGPCRQRTIIDAITAKRWTHNLTTMSYLPRHPKFPGYRLVVIICIPPKG